MFDPTHPSFRHQPEPDEPVWRYMDLARFVSLLSSSAIHFARADAMTDKWEGAYGHANREARAARGSLVDIVGREAMADFRKGIQQLVHMSCWHASAVESAAMWDLYQRDGRGIALRSTWGALISALRTEREVVGGFVEYVNYRTRVIGETNLLTPYSYKRESFAHEREVRLVMMTGRAEPPDAPPAAQQVVPEEGVIPVPVDLGILIDRVHVAPGAPNWITQVVVELLARYEQDVRVLQSDLDEDPVF